MSLSSSALGRLGRLSRGEGCRRMIELSPAGRGGTPDEVGTVGALLMGAEGAFITGSDFLMDGGVAAAYCTASSPPKAPRHARGLLSACREAIGAVEAVAKKRGDASQD